MRRLDELVRELVESARARVVTEHACVASNDDEPIDEAKRAKFLAIARELNETARKRRNRRRRRAKAG